MPLDDHLTDHLPPHETPTQARRPDDRPLAPGGALDRDQLPADVEDEVEQPRTPMEALVASVFGELLGRPPAQLDEDFFALGGHSMLAVRAVHEIAEKTGIELELETFFDLETVEDIAAELDRLLATVERVTHEGEI
ncbi:phosphopantetheine-binding protein [Streptomyces sp. NPDC059761]|uniref:phosphopantetheine-binding protein n=1 Tax=Streptomyces sp. NPDC059761 TaxID=3346937 RepID=UPI00365B4DBD